MAQPADGPSLGVPASGQWICNPIPWCFPVPSPLNFSKISLGSIFHANVKAQCIDSFITLPWRPVNFSILNFLSEGVNITSIIVIPPTPELVA